MVFIIATLLNVDFSFCVYLHFYSINIYYYFCFSEKWTQPSISAFPLFSQCRFCLLLALLKKIVYYLPYVWVFLCVYIHIYFRVIALPSKQKCSVLNALFCTFSWNTKFLRVIFNLHRLSYGLTVGQEINRTTYVRWRAHGFYIVWKLSYRWSYNCIGKPIWFCRLDSVKVFPLKYWTV